VLAMRWAWVDQGTGRPIGGPRRAFRVHVRQAQAWEHHTQSPWCPLLMEQEAKDDGLIRRALSSLFDPLLAWATLCERAAANTGPRNRGSSDSLPLP
jgi:hypothetical protein